MTTVQVSGDTPHGPTPCRKRLKPRAGGRSQPAPVTAGAGHASAERMTATEGSSDRPRGIPNCPAALRPKTPKSRADVKALTWSTPLHAQERGAVPVPGDGGNVGDDLPFGTQAAARVGHTLGPQCVRMRGPGPRAASRADRRAWLQGLKGGDTHLSEPGQRYKGRGRRGRGPCPGAGRDRSADGSGCGGEGKEGGFPGRPQAAQGALVTDAHGRPNTAKRSRAALKASKGWGAGGGGRGTPTAPSWRGAGGRARAGSPLRASGVSRPRLPGRRLGPGLPGMRMDAAGPPGGGGAAPRPRTQDAASTRPAPRRAPAPAGSRPRVTRPRGPRGDISGHGVPREPAGRPSRARPSRTHLPPRASGLRPRPPPPTEPPARPAGPTSVSGRGAVGAGPDLDSRRGRGPPRTWLPGNRGRAVAPLAVA